MLNRVVPANVNDDALVARARGGDPEACRALFDRYREVAYRLAYRITGHRADALDVVQEAFVKAFQNLDGFADRAMFKTWFLRIVTNAGLDALRTRRVRPAGPLESATEKGASAECEPSHRAELKEATAMITEQMQMLPAEQKSVLALYLGGGLTYGEIAEIVGVPVGTVMSRLYHARRKIRQGLNSESDTT